MTDVEQLLEKVLAHAYDPVEAHNYYMKNRKLKGRHHGLHINIHNPFHTTTKVDQYKKNKSPFPKHIEEDAVPMKSRTGAKLVNFKGKSDGYPSGRAEYSDGSYFDGNGWHNTKSHHLPHIDAMHKKLDNLEHRLAHLPKGKRDKARKKIEAARKKLHLHNPFKHTKTKAPSSPSHRQALSRD